MSSKKKILIIGGAGFVGSNLAKFLIQNREVELTLADYSFTRNKSEYFTEKSTRSAVGVASLPLNVCVEVQCVFTYE